MDNKKIISHPTPKTSPDLLVYGKDKFANISNHNDKVVDDYIVLPRSFNDAMKSFPTIQKYQKEKYHKRFFGVKRSGNISRMSMEKVAIVWLIPMNKMP